MFVHYQYYFPSTITRDFVWHPFRSLLLSADCTETLPLIYTQEKHPHFSGVNSLKQKCKSY